MTAKEAKKRWHPSASQTALPCLGIVYLVEDKLWIDASRLAQASNFGDLAFHERDHEEYWKQLVNQGVVPSAEHTAFPRGRVSHDRQRGRFMLLADRCILRKKHLVSAILSQMHLPTQGTKIGTDGNYRCLGCRKAGIAKLTESLVLICVSSTTGE